MRFILHFLWLLTNPSPCVCEQQSPLDRLCVRLTNAGWHVVRASQFESLFHFYMTHITTAMPGIWSHPAWAPTRGSKHPPLPVGVSAEAGGIKMSGGVQKYSSAWQGMIYFPIAWARTKSWAESNSISFQVNLRKDYMILSLTFQASRNLRYSAEALRLRTQGWSGHFC